MGTFLMLLACIFTPSFLGAIFWKLREPEKEAALRELADISKAMPKLPTQEEQQERTKGNSLLLGECDYWTEKRSFPFFTPKIEIVRDKFFLPAITRYMNMLVLGLTGSGKSTAMLTYMAQDIAKKDNAVVIFDPKGDFTPFLIALCKMFGRELVILPDQGGFNPFNGDGDANDRGEAAADQYAMVANVGEHPDVEHWVNVATLYIKNVVCLYEAVAHQPMIVNEMLTHLRNAEARDWLLEMAACTPEGRAYREAIHDRWKEADFRESLSGYEVFLDSLSRGKTGYLFNQRHAPTLKEYIDRKAVIVIRKQGGPKGTQERRQGLIFMSALQQWALHRDTRKSPHPVIVYLDEAQHYLSHSFPPFITNNRGFLTSLVLSIQNLTQLDPYRETVAGAARTKIANPDTKEEDAEELARGYGRATWKDRSRTEGEDGEKTRVSESERHDYIVQPSQISDIGENEAYVLTVNGRRKERPVKIEKIPPIAIEPEHYVPLEVPSYPPPTYFDEHMGKEQEPQQQPQSVKAPQRGGGRKRASKNAEQSTLDW